MEFLGRFWKFSYYELRQLHKNILHYKKNGTWAGFIVYISHFLEI